MMAQSRERLFTPDVWKALGDHTAYDEIELPLERFRRWHPLNQSLFLANKVMLSGMLLAAKGDRAMHNASTEGRFPFLDEDVVSFCTGLEPRYKVRGYTEKWLLRQVAAKILPNGLARRPKTMFRAHFSSTFIGPERPAWVDQLLSPRVAARDRLLRHAGGAGSAVVSGAQGSGEFRPLRHGHGPDRRDRDAVVAPHLLWRRLGRSAFLVAAVLQRRDPAPLVSEDAVSLRP